MEDKIIDQSLLAESVAKGINTALSIRWQDFFLVKPLDPIKVKKEFNKPVSNGAPTEDANGVKAQDFDNVETEVKEVDSDFRKCIVIKRPLYYNVQDSQEIKVGDVVIIKDTSGMWFDLIKNSRLVRQYDILGVER